MTLGQMVNELIAGEDIQPKALAQDWVDNWKERSGESLSYTTATSRISNLRNDNAHGVRFFFHEDPARGELLLDLLGVGAELRPEIRSKAAEALNKETVPPRVVIDLSPFEVGPAFMGALVGLLRDDLPLEPATVLLTEEQWGSVPQGLINRPEVLVFEVVADSNVACDRLAELGEQPLLVVSRDPFEPVERWAAIDFDDGPERFVLHPADAFQVFRTAGRLRGPVEVAHPLEDVCSDAVERELPDSTARGIRDLIIELAAGGPARVPPEVRLGWAQELDVQASSTPRERLNKALADANLQVARTWTREELELALVQARREPVADRVLLVDGIYHLINAPEFVTPPGTDALVQIHHVTQVTPGIRRLRDALATYTVDDWRDDPLLAKLLSQLRGDAGPDAELRHARAWLLHQCAPEPAPAEFPQDAVERLKAVLAGPIPNAELLMSGKDLILGPDRHKVETDMLAHVVSRGELLVRRSDIPMVLTRATMEWLNRRPDARRRRPWEAAPAAGTDAACLENFDVGISLWDRPPSSIPGLTRLRLDEETWDEADRWVAVCWRALRRAAERGEVERFGERRMLIDLGNDLIAVVETRTWSRGEARRAAVPVGNPHGGVTLNVQCVVTHKAGSDRCGPLLPNVFWFAGAGIAADVRFAAAGPLAAASGAGGLRLRPCDDD